MNKRVEKFVQKDRQGFCELSEGEGVSLVRLIRGRDLNFLEPAVNDLSENVALTGVLEELGVDVSGMQDFTLDSMKKLGSSYEAVVSESGIFAMNARRVEDKVFCAMQGYVKVPDVSLIEQIFVGSPDPHNLAISAVSRRYLLSACNVLTYDSHLEVSRVRWFLFKK